MKKWFCLILVFFLIACSNGDEMPELQSRTLNYEYGQKVFFRMDDFLNLTEFSQDEIDELEKNGKIDTSSLVYDDAGNIEVGVYKIKITYHDEVVYSTLNIETEAMELFDFDDLYEIKVALGDRAHDFSKDVTARSIHDTPVSITYDTEEIDFDQLGSYPLYLVISDNDGNQTIHTYTVVIVEETSETASQQSNEEKKEEKSEESATSTEQTPVNTQTAGNSTAPATNSSAGNAATNADTNTPSTDHTGNNTIPSAPNEDATAAESGENNENTTPETPVIPEESTTDVPVENETAEPSAEASQAAGDESSAE